MIESLAEGWELDVESADYAAVGAGSYHWIVRDRTGTRSFVTVDDLDVKPWLGDTRESVFDGLRRAFDTAAALRDSGLDFVVAPVPTSRGETVRRLGGRYAVAVFPFVDGRAGEFGHHDTADERAAVVAMLSELHDATPAVGPVAPSTGLDLPGRWHLESALREVNETWSGGPFSEPARHALADHASDVAELLALADRLAAEVEEHGSPWVITHGEPHAGNVMRTNRQHFLVDWDTVALAPPERDLWMVLGDTPSAGVDETALNFFRLTWDMKDLAGYLDVLRSPHQRSGDTEIAFECITACVASRDRWAALL